jgi:hypothetical protein
MHLALRSKSAGTKIKEGTVKCDSCNTITKYFVAILASFKPAKYHMICISCYEDDTWQTRISRKELTTKTGSSSGSMESGSKQKKSHSQGRSEESGAETSTSHWTDGIW